MIVGNASYILSIYFQIYVFFADENKDRIGVTPIKNILNRMKEDRVYRAIVVTKKDITSFARNCVIEVSTKYHLEIFLVN